MSGLISFNPFDFINQLIAYALILAAFLAVTMIIYGGFMFILAAGKEERVQSAIHTIKYSIIGLIVCILSFSIVYYIGKFFGYNFIEYLSIENIIETIENIGTQFE